MADHFNFSGAWRCRYWYPSNKSDGQEASEYVVDVYQRGNKLTLESRPNDSNSHMTVNLTVEGRLLTGNWLENTSPTGEFEGLVYSGALQLLAGRDGREVTGKWVGVGREKLEDGGYEPQIYSGNWTLEKMDDANA